MRHLLCSAAALGVFMNIGAARAACGDISLALFSWQSAEVMANVDQFILKNGYGCNATTVVGDTVPTITSMAEKGQPDVASETTPSLLPETVVRAIADKKIVELNTKEIVDGTVSGWYIPKYLAEAHPDIKTIGDALKHPELFPSPEDLSKGVVFQGPQGWGDTVVTSQVFKAMGAASKNFVLLPTGSAAALDGSIARAYERKRGFIATYWSPTSVLQKFPMVRLEAGVPFDDAEWKRCTTVGSCPDPKPNYWRQVDMTTLISGKFASRADVAPAIAYLKGRGWTSDTVGGLMLWMTENQATGVEGAKYFLKTQPEIWTKWLPADVAAKVKAAL